MPTYIYETIPAAPDITADRFEVRQSFSEAPLTVHPETGAPVRRMISGGMAVMPNGKTSAPEAAGPGCGPANCHCGRFD